MSRETKPQRLAVDIGGTFVDAVTFDRESRTVAVEKVSTTPDRPSAGVLDAVEAVEGSLAATEAFVHGTTGR